MEALQRNPQWEYSLESLKSNSPSLKDGIPFDEELQRQSRGVRFIAQVCEQLQLPPVTVYTAITFFHRFYLRYSHKQANFYDVSGACIFLASKSEETSRRLKEVGIACTRVALKKPKMQVPDNSRDLLKWMAVITFNEELLLQALYFDFNVDNPYNLLKQQLSQIGQEENQQLSQAAIQFINDSCKTLVQNVFVAKDLAAGAILWAIVSQKIEIDSTWWQTLGYEREHLVNVVNAMVDMYRSEGFYSTIE